MNIAIINSPLFDFRNVENLLADGLGSGNTAFDIVKIPLTSFKLDKLPYNELEIKVTESKKYSDIQLNRVLNKLLNFTWPPFKDHFEYPSIEVPDYDGWKVVNMSKKLDFPSSFEKGNILDFIQMVNNCTSDARDAVWVTNVTNLDYRVNFRHAALYLMEGFARLIDGTSADLKDVQNAKLILLNTAASWDTYEPYKPVAKYHYVRGRNKERFERQGVFNMQVIPKDNRNCHIFELVALGQRILRKTKNLTEKNDITKVLFSFRKDFNCFTKLEENLPEYETMETILLNAIVLAGIYTQHFAPERILGHDWLIQHPLVSPVAAFEDINLNPYMLAATLTKKYIGILKCKKYIKPAEASK